MSARTTAAPAIHSSAIDGRGRELPAPCSNARQSSSRDRRNSGQERHDGSGASGELPGDGAARRRAGEEARGLPPGFLLPRGGAPARERPRGPRASVRLRRPTALLAGAALPAPRDGRLAYRLKRPLGDGRRAPTPCATTASSPRIPLAPRGGSAVPRRQSNTVTQPLCCPRASPRPRRPREIPAASPGPSYCCGSSTRRCSPAPAVAAAWCSPT